MSARVFKPILLSEMPKMRSSPSLDARYTTSRGITKVRRALFNPDQEENRRFLDDELAKIAAAQSERWNFDFLSGRPIILDSTNTTTQYAWISVRQSRPSVIIPQRPVKHVIPQSPDITELYPPIITSETLEDEKMSTDESSPTKESSPPKKQLQSKITDFLLVRKRSEASTSSSKKLAGKTPRPRKIPRLTTS